jgi:hypothetical protein
MKVNKLVSKLYKSILKKDKDKEKKVWFKLLRKSLKHKKTQAVK